MKTYKHLFEPMVEEGNITECFFSAAKRKTTRSDVAKVLKPERTEGNDSPEPDCLREHVKELQKQLIEETWRPSKHRPQLINEHSCGKIREIIKPYYKYEQVVHHCVVKQLQPIVMHGIYEHALGSIPKRGAHSGKKTLEKWLDEYKGKKLYVLKVDVRHCFETEDIKVIEQKLANIIRDDRFLRLCNLILESEAHWTTGEFLKDGEHLDFAGESEERLAGIPLGFFTSQWIMQLNFKKFDHLMKEKWGAKKYIRYADDIVVLDTNKKRLHKLRQTIEEYLENDMHQTLKGNWQIFRFEYPVKQKAGAEQEPGKKAKTRGRAIDFMGFVFHYNRTTMRKSILYRSRRKANRIAKKDKVTWYDAAALLSYMGWYDHTDTYDYFQKYIKPCADIRKLKRMVSKHSRKEQKEYDRLVQSAGDGEAGGVRHDIKPDDRLPEEGHQKGETSCDGGGGSAGGLRVSGENHDAGGVPAASGGAGKPGHEDDYAAAVRD